MGKMALIKKYCCMAPINLVSNCVKYQKARCRNYKRRNRWNWKTRNNEETEAPEYTNTFILKTQSLCDAQNADACFQFQKKIMLCFKARLQRKYYAVHVLLGEDVFVEEMEEERMRCLWFILIAENAAEEFVIIARNWMVDFVFGVLLI